MAKKKNYYAVRVGRTPGIYNTWDEVKPLVNGFSAAKYKGFATLEEAEAFMNQSQDGNIFPDDSFLEEFLSKPSSSVQIKPKKESSKIIHLETMNEYIAYVDGSYDTTNSCYGSGIVIVKNNNVIEELSFYRNNPNYTVSYQIAGEVSAAIAAIEWAIENNLDKITIAYDYQGIELWVTGDWQARKAVSIDYVERFNQLSETISVHFNKVKGHSGDIYNDRADQLAALGIEQKKIHAK